MRWRLSLALLAAMALSTAANAAQTRLDQLPADTRWLLHVDVQDFLETTIGQEIRDKARETQAANRLRAVKAMFGVHLLDDIHEMMLAGPNRDRDAAVLYVAGDFPPERLSAILAAIEGYSAEDHHGTTIHSWPDQRRGEGHRAYGAFADAHLIVMAGSAQAVRKALDAIASRRDTLDADTVFPGWDDVDDRRYFVAGVARGLDNIERMHPQAKALSQIEDLVMTLSEEGNDLVAGVQVKTDSNEAATQLTQVLQGLRALALLSAEAHPEGAELAQAARVSSSGRRVELTIALPLSKVREVMKKAQQKRRQNQGFGGPGGRF